MRIGPALEMASTPRCGREPWAARPRTSTSDHTNPLCGINHEVGRLGDDRGVRPHGLEDLLDAEARVLLVGDCGDDDVAGETAGRHLTAGY